MKRIITWFGINNQAFLVGLWAFVAARAFASYTPWFEYVEPPPWVYGMVLFLMAFNAFERWMRDRMEAALKPIVESALKQVAAAQKEDDR